MESPQISWVPVLGYLLVGLPVLMALLVGIVVSARAYRVNPNRQRAIGLVGFAVFFLTRVVAIVGIGVLPQLRSVVTPFMLQSLYFAVDLFTAIGLVCIIYSYWELSRGR